MPFLLILLDTITIIFIITPYIGIVKKKRNALLEGNHPLLMALLLMDIIQHR